VEVATFSYKVVVVLGGGAVVWETTPNRSPILALPPASRNHSTEEVWRLETDWQGLDAIPHCLKYWHPFPLPTKQANLQAAGAALAEGPAAKMTREKVGRISLEERKQPRRKGSSSQKKITPRLPAVHEEDEGYFSEENEREDKMRIRQLEHDNASLKVPQSEAAPTSTSSVSPPRRCASPLRKRAGRANKELLEIFP